MSWLFVVTVVYSLACISGVWWAIFAGQRGLMMGIFVAGVIGALCLVCAAQVASTRRRY